MMRVRGFPFTLVAMLFVLTGPVRGARFSRGDVNVDGVRDISDAIVTLGLLFLGNPSEVPCRDAADCDDSGELDISDAIYLLAALFVGGDPLPPPLDCGDDPTPDRLECASFEKCPDVDVFALISCDFPEDGSMIQADPGSSIEFRGRVEGGVIIDTVEVDGVQVELGPDGSFRQTVDVGYGVNFVEIRARAMSGTEFARTCTFLAAPQFAPEDQLLDNAVILALGPAAIDDGNRSALDSLGDLLGVVLSSDATLASIDDQLKAANPLKNSCDVTDPIFGSCLLRSRVDYRGGLGFSSSSVSVTPATNRLDLALTLGNLAIPLGVSGTFSSDGTVTINSVTATASFRIGVSGGEFQVTVDSPSVTVEVGSISTDFSGLSGTIIDIVISIANGSIRALIADELADLIRQQVPSILTSVLKTLDVSSLGDRLEVPTLDGRDTVVIDFTVAPGGTETASSGLALGLATGFQPESGHQRSSLGVALASGSNWRVPTTPRPVAVGASAGFFNHALHALWRGGVLDGRFDGTRLSDAFPADAEIITSARLPPVVEILPDGTALLMLGGLDLEFLVPGLFDTPLPLKLGALLEAPVELSEGELSFGAAEVRRLELSTQTGPLSPGSLDALETLLTAIVTQSANELLQTKIPAFPLPTFTLPASLETFGLPAGATFGLADPGLRALHEQLILDGSFAGTE